jgi:hypothetical protein
VITSDRLCHETTETIHVTIRAQRTKRIASDVDAQNTKAEKTIRKNAGQRQRHALPEEPMHCLRQSQYDVLEERASHLDHSYCLNRDQQK